MGAIFTTADKYASLPTRLHIPCGTIYTMSLTFINIDIILMIDENVKKHLQWSDHTYTYFRVNWNKPAYTNSLNDRHK